MADEIRGPLPVKVDATSNGEFRPVPLTEPVARANSEAELRIGDNAKRVGLGRRAFLQSLCGAATTLLTLNEAFAALGNTGGLFRMPEESAFETAAAAEALAGDEFIFDVQTHMVDPAGAWRSSAGKLLGANPRQLPSRFLRRRRPGRLLFLRAIHQARLYGQRYRARGAFVRARIAGKEPTFARRGKSGARSG